MLNFYVDGSCTKNGGGYGVVCLVDNKIEYMYSEQCKDTTNNKEELKALIHAFEIIKTQYPHEIVKIHCDSSYCVNICNEWIHNWARNNWLRYNNKPIENLSFVQTLYKYVNKNFPNCQVVKVNGHAGIIGNELADALATGNKTKFDKILKENSISIERKLKIEN